MSSKFRFKLQSYQTDAVWATAGVFKGQPYSNAAKYTRDLGTAKNKQTSFLMAMSNMDKGAENLWDISDIGFANAPIALGDEQILTNIKAVQQRYGVDRVSDVLCRELGGISLDVEMETGTGKTYVYIKTMFELNERYGWNKFIIVVPSVAIREGVKKSFDQMEDHFMDTYKKKSQYFIYDSDNLTRLDQFSSSNNIQVMIINYQAFNSTKNSNIIDTVTEKFQDRRPIDVISATRPILILDEPQKLGGVATQAGLKKFKCLFSINYSATHVKEHNLVYQLDALAAYNQYLVKKIEVKGIDIKNLKGTGKYLYLQDIILSTTEAPKARLEFEKSYKNGIKRETSILKKGDDLYAKSSQLEQYKDRYIISNIDANEGTVTFLNGEELRIKEAHGFKEEKDLRRVQIRETIVTHFDKEEEMLYQRRIKCLSLFFIDEVAKYKLYGESGEELLGEYGIIFEEEYASELNHRLENTTNVDYKKYLQEMCMDASKVHNGYFSIDKKGKAINSQEKRGSEGSDDISAYDLILKNKERLLSYHEPTRFIFSHSALREGWDNPNVFQICTLKQSDSKISKRQEIGRGLRICRDSMLYSLQDRQQAGSDALFHKINKLTVIATDSYKDFVSAFQNEMAEVIKDKPTQANEHFFVGKLLYDEEYNRLVVSKTHARLIYKYLVKNDYIDESDHITEEYRNDLSARELKPLPKELATYGESLHRLVQSVYDPKMLKGMIEDGNAPKYKEIKTNANFDRKEFQALWNEINHRYAYQVSFDSIELIDKSIKAINNELRVNEMAYTVTWSEQRKEMDAEQLKAKDIFYTEKTRTEKILPADSDIEYDLVGKIATATTLTRRTVVEILSKIGKDKFDMFQANPEEFIAKVSKIIEEQKATTLVDHIVYNVAEGTHGNEIFTVQKTALEYETAQNARNHILDKVFTDSTIESQLAKAMDVAEEVCVYAKLPRAFYIPTPVGNYSPDWAIAFDDGKGIKHVYFIAETKGDLSSLELRPVEKAKIECARKLFNNLSNKKIKYEAITDYSQLLALVKD
ncbi:MAG: DEAD/DEAH box helicase family protein [Christensenellaceae bacterium]|jgi:type III restriction enzyme|nr:DEAD/DEAH box helicase family protein [Christensenellaceae bacterium]